MAKMPLAGHICMVPPGFQNLRQGGDLKVQISNIAGISFHFGCPHLAHRSHTRQVIIHTGKKNRAGRGTTGQHMKVGEPQSFPGQGVQRGGGYLAAERTDIGITHIISNDQEDIGPF